MKRKIQYKAERRAQGTRFVPSLSLAGKWLREAGFEIGQNVTISIKAGQLVISK